MTRYAIRFAVLGLSGAAALAALVAAGLAADAPVARAPAQSIAVKRAAELRDRLAMPVTVEFETGDLKDALAFLTERYNVPIHIDSAAFEADLSMLDVDRMQVKLQKVVGISLRTVLRLLVAQVQGDFRIMNEMLLVVPHTRMLPEVLFKEAVNASFEKQPLTEALQEISALTGVSVVVDVSAGDNVRVPVTAILTDAPLQTAVRILANMADLKVVPMDNVLYVTTTDKAQQLDEEKDRCRAAMPKVGAKE
jgi:type II secretory pathway component HofQ